MLHLSERVSAAPCDELRVGGLTQWFLISKQTLQLLLSADGLQSVQSCRTPAS